MQNKPTSTPNCSAKLTNMIELLTNFRLLHILFSLLSFLEFSCVFRKREKRVGIDLRRTRADQVCLMKSSECFRSVVSRYHKICRQHARRRARESQTDANVCDSVHRKPGALRFSSLLSTQQLCQLCYHSLGKSQGWHTNTPRLRKCLWNPASEKKPASASAPRVDLGHASTLGFHAARAPGMPSAPAASAQ